MVNRDKFDHCIKWQNLGGIPELASLSWSIYMYMYMYNVHVHVSVKDHFNTIGPF